MQRLQGKVIVVAGGGGIGGGLARRYAAEGASVVGPWVQEQGVEYPILIGDESLAREFGALGFPTLVIVAPDGTIQSSHVGLVEAAELEDLVGRARAS